MNKILSLLLLIMIIPCYVYADTAALPFLNLSPTAQSGALGGAYMGGTPNESSLYYNISDLNKMSKFVIYSTYSNLYSSIKYNTFGTAFPLPYNIGTMGIGLMTVDYGVQEEIDYNRTIIGEFSNKDTLIILGFGKILGDGFGYGVATKFVSSKVYTYSASASMADVNFSYSGASTKFAATIQNLTLKNPKYSITENVPTQIRYGGSFMIIDYPSITMKLLLDQNQSFHAKSYLASGLETVFEDTLAVRFGYNTKNQNNFTAGLGFLSKYFALDYAYINHEMGATHQFSLSLGW